MKEWGFDVTQALLTVNLNDHLVSNSRDSMIAASERWNCIFVEVNEVDVKEDMKCPPQFLKLRAFDFTDADDIFMVDADTIIRHNTPSPFVELPDVFCACINKQPHLGMHLDAARLIEPSEFDKIYAAGFPRVDFNFDMFVNSGVWKANREQHKKILDYAYMVGLTTGTLGWWDQAALNYSLASHKTPVHLADITWNYCMPPSHFEPMTHYIYHFAGVPPRLEILPLIDWRSG